MSADSCTRCRVMSLVLATLAGLLFGAGLIVAGMTQPSRVLGFLNVLDWDPTLAFVMAGGIAVYATASRVIQRRRRDPWFDVQFHLPTRRDIDIQLVLGAALFGIGWGLGGLCPGPGIVSVGAATAGSLAFLIPMSVGLSARV